VKADGTVPGTLAEGRIMTPLDRLTKTLGPEPPARYSPGGENGRFGPDKDRSGMPRRMALPVHPNS